MSSSSSKPGSSTEQAPIDEFATCHEGIVLRLTALRDLPALLEPAARARRIAEEALAFFRPVVHGHHQDEERELFPAVLASAQAGAEREQVQALVGRLTAEHRSVEATWQALEPTLKAVAQGREAPADVAALTGLVDEYLAHAQFEEQEFLPLSRQILGRNSDHLAALGMSLHARHALPGLLRRYGARG